MSLVDLGIIVERMPPTERLAGQMSHGGSRSREPAERLVGVSAILTVQTTRRSDFPNLSRGQSETAEEFADRVREELVRLQRGF